MSVKTSTVVETPKYARQSRVAEVSQSRYFEMNSFNQDVIFVFVTNQELIITALNLEPMFPVSLFY
jgi:hypothetical protein